MRRVVIGTAGHIDHGKTKLVQALTDRDTDRLPEEKSRGISIELGFAPLPLGDDLMVGIIDVPGHEKFVRTMIAGASGVDAVLVVIAADEGIQLQTREHLEICRLLGVEYGICALTKSDLVSDAEIENRLNEASSYLSEIFPSQVPMIPVSSKEGLGLSQLKEEIRRVIRKIPYPRPESVLSLPIDRVFSLEGMGTVITGTLSGSSLTKGEKLVALPGNVSVQARSLQIFDDFVERAEPKTRLAVNLTGSNRTQVQRGQTLCRESEMRMTKKIHASLQWLEEGAPPSRQIVRILCGTQDLAARIVGTKKGEKTPLVEIRFLDPALLRMGDRFVIRTESPARTIAGGTVLDPQPENKFSLEQVSSLQGASPEERVVFWIENSKRSHDVMGLAQRSSLPVQGIQTFLRKRAESGSLHEVSEGRFVGQKTLTDSMEVVRSIVTKRGEIPSAELTSHHQLKNDKDLALFVLEKLSMMKEFEMQEGRLRVREAESEEIHPAVVLIRERDLSPPTVEELSNKLGDDILSLRKTLARNVSSGKLIRISESLYFSTSAISKAQVSLRTLATGNTSFTLAQWKTSVGLTRKYAVPLLEYFDRERYTLCKPDRTRIPGPKFASL